jgi:hypothetical protein
MTIKDTDTVRNFAFMSVYLVRFVRPGAERSCQTSQYSQGAHDQVLVGIVQPSLESREKLAQTRWLDPLLGLVNDLADRFNRRLPNLYTRTIGNVRVWSTGNIGALDSEKGCTLKGRTPTEL